MPSPRAILNDIHDLKLDPKKVHVATTKSGRLSVGSSKDKKKDVEKPGLVFLSSDEEVKKSTNELDHVEIPTDVVEEPVVETTVVEKEEKDAKKNYAMSEKQKKKQQYQKKNSYNN